MLKSLAWLEYDSREWSLIFHNQSLELQMKKKKRGNFRGIPGHAPTPQKILKVEIKICAIQGILEANLKNVAH